jgi:hypothetical protein
MFAQIVLLERQMVLGIYSQEVTRNATQPNVQSMNEW